MIRRRKLPNFSFNIVLEEEVVFVPNNQQMSVYQEQEIRNEGELEIEGEVIVYE